MINKFFDFIVSTYLGGLILILFGIYALYLVKKHPDNERTAAFAGDLRGKIGGTSLIILGILIWITKIFNLK